MKKICTVVGARPQFIKLAVVSREIRQDFQEVIIHTGQHYDYNMSDVFFEELEIPKPDYNLGISGGTHGKMTGEMLLQLEEVFLKETPDLVLLYGDTNSTMAGALAAVKLGIPVAHIEAGNRLGTLSNPEEVNRIVTDHVSSIHFACVASCLPFLKNEGLEERVHLVGDPMYDAFLHYSEKNDGSELENILDLEDKKIILPGSFYYLTCHRQENTQDPTALYQILSAMNALEEKTIYPVHPRSQQIVSDLCQSHCFENLILVQPVGYLTSISLVCAAKKVVTDSGGLQREAFFAKKQCVTVFPYVGWPETMVGGCNQLAKAEKDEILDLLNRDVIFEKDYQPFGDGQSAKKICQVLKEQF